MTHLGAKSVKEYSEKMAKERAQKQSLNEEQMAQGQKELGVFNYQVWECIAPPTAKTKERTIFVECERFYDVRAYAILYFGVPLVEVKMSENRPLPRIQLRWTGNAAASANLRKQIRTLKAGMPAEDGWRDL